MPEKFEASALVLTSSLEAEFGGTFRFAGRGAIDGVEVLRGRFYLADAHGR